MENLLDEFPIQRTILFRKGVDSGIEKILRYGKLARKLGGREHRPVIAGDEFFKEVPDRSVGVRQINVTAPDPVIRAGGAAVNERSRLRVVDDHEFSIEWKL